MDTLKFRALTKALTWLIVALLPVSAITLSCGGGVIQRIDDPNYLPPAPPKQGFLRLPDGPDDARIYIDGVFRGRLSHYSRGAMLLAVGAHRVKITAAGHTPIYALVKVSTLRPAELTGSMLSLEPPLLDTSLRDSPPRPHLQRDR